MLSQIGAPVKGGLAGLQPPPFPLPAPLPWVDGQRATSPAVPARRWLRQPARHGSTARAAPEPSGAAAVCCARGVRRTAAAATASPRYGAARTVQLRLFCRAASRNEARWHRQQACVGGPHSGRELLRTSAAAHTSSLACAGPRRERLPQWPRRRAGALGSRP
eukprot:364596-Chlamydomonas_euryale.AAC.1